MQVKVHFANVAAGPRPGGLEETPTAKLDTLARHCEAAGQ
jgi:hypothetical protein